MSDKAKLFYFIYSYIIFWFMMIGTYLIFTGIMQLLKIIFHFNQNVWQVGLVVFVIFIVHHISKRNGSEVVEKMDDKIQDEKWKK